MGFWTFFFARGNQRIGNFPKQSTLAENATDRILPIGFACTHSVADWLTGTLPCCKHQAVIPLLFRGGKPGKQGRAQHRSPSAICPNSYLPWAILVTLFCCTPGGIISIVYASRVKPLWLGGKYAESAKAPKNAKMWIFIAIGCMVATLLVATLLFFFSDKTTTGGLQ